MLGRALHADGGSRRLLYVVWLLYAAVVLLAVRRHEPWADEAQAWLLARDSTLIDLWASLVRYEGSPALWHTLLHGLTTVGLPYYSLNLLSAALAIGTAWLILFCAPLPIWVRILLPFSYFLCYQYAVVARSYSLVPLLLFAAAALYGQADRRLWIFTIVLCLLAAVSVHGFVISVAVALAWGFARWRSRELADWRRVLPSASVYAIALIAIAASAWPPKDVTFVKGPSLSLTQFLAVTGAVFREAFTGNLVASLVVIGISIPFLWRGGSLLFYVMSSAVMCALGAIVYIHVWHFGLLFLVWLGAIWMAASRVRPTGPLIASLLAAVVLQCYWTVSAIGFDLGHRYSGSKEAARFLAATTNKTVYGLGYSTTSLQPYFAQNRFVNFNGGSKQAYWDWSIRNRNNDPIALFTESPDYIVAGYKADDERKEWANLAAMGGYKPTAHFEGSLFWRTQVNEPEGFDIYARGAHDNSSLDNVLTMNDPSVARQLVCGFHEPESNAWRWTERRFGVVLKRPDACRRGAALLKLALYVPETQIRMLGPVTLRAAIGRYPVPPAVIGQAGRTELVREVPASALHSDAVPVSFQLDKATPPTGADTRELGIVVERIELQPKR